MPPTFSPRAAETLPLIGFRQRGHSWNFAGLVILIPNVMCSILASAFIVPLSRRVLPGAKPAPSPGFIEPCDPTLREQAPEGSGWLHEIKITSTRAG
jgi:hypothetical protein